jgi:hypothetical protein
LVILFKNPFSLREAKMSNLKTFNCKCTLEALVPIRGLIDASASHSSRITWAPPLMYMQSDGDRMSLGNIAKEKFPYYNMGMPTVETGLHLVNANTELFNAECNEPLWQAQLAKVDFLAEKGKKEEEIDDEDGLNKLKGLDENIRDSRKYVPGLIMVSTMDMEFAHLKGYGGEALPFDDVSVAYEAWATQIRNTEIAAASSPLRLFPLFSYDPRRYRLSSGAPQGEGGEDCEPWDAPFARIAGSSKKDGGCSKIWLGFCMNPALGFRPSDELCERLPMFYEKCEKEDIPILANCAAGGIATHDAEHYKDKRNAFLRESNKDDNSSKFRGTETVIENTDYIDNTSLDHFYRNYGHPRNWLPVLKERPDLRLCLSGFGGNREWLLRADSPRIDSREWIRCVIKLTRYYKNVYVDVSGLNIYDPLIRFGLLTMLDLVQDDKNKDFKHLKHKLMFGSGWYLTHVMDMSNNINYGTYCSEFKGLFDHVDPSGKLWELVSLINPWNFYGLSKKKIDGIYDELAKNSSGDVNCEMLEKMKKVFDGGAAAEGLIDYVSRRNNEEKPLAGPETPDKGDRDLGELGGDIQGTSTAEKLKTAIYKAVEFVETNKKYDGITACNISVEHVFNGLTGSDELKGKDGEPIAANKMFAHFTLQVKHGRFRKIDINKKDDFMEIQKLANQGNMIIAAYKNPNPQEHGHVVMIIPGEMKERGNWEINGELQYIPLPFVMDTGIGARNKGEQTTRRISLSFNSKIHKDVVFFYIFENK